MIEKFINFTDEENKLIIKYFTDNFLIIFPLFKKLINYTFNRKFSIISNEEMKKFNSIPVNKKYKLKLPIVIYRGMTLSDKIIEKMKSEFKQNKKLTYNPKKQFSSWSMDKQSSEAFSSGDTKLIFISSLTEKIVYLDINLFYCICENLVLYLGNLKYDKKTKLSKDEQKLYSFLNDISDYLYGEKEILVFNKIEVNKIFTR